MPASRGNRTNFPSFSEGLSLRPVDEVCGVGFGLLFPFLFGGTFIEADGTFRVSIEATYFPSFSEGLSLRLHHRRH